jgi:hypothetical protein
MNMKKHSLLFSLFFIVVTIQGGTGVSRWLYKAYSDSYLNFLNEHPELGEMLSDAFSNYKNFLEKDAEEKLFKCLNDTQSTLESPALECKLLKKYWLERTKEDKSIEQYKVFERLADNVGRAHGTKHGSDEYQEKRLKCQKLSEKYREKSKEYQGKNLEYQELSKKDQERSQRYQGERKDYWEEHSKRNRDRSKKYQKQSKKYQKKSEYCDKESKESQELSKKLQDESDAIVKDILNQ